MPKLWNETIEKHRQAVERAILDTTATLVAQHGLATVTMSAVAEQAGIGRATLYKYFPDVGAILFAWHERHIRQHLRQLIKVRDQAGDAHVRLEAVLDTYATIHFERRDGELSALLHGGSHVAATEQELKAFVTDLIGECAAAGDLRNDVAPEELAGYCLHALGAASALRSKAAIRRLVAVTLAGMRPQG